MFKKVQGKFIKNLKVELDVSMKFFYLNGFTCPCVLISRVSIC